MKAVIDNGVFFDEAKLPQRHRAGSDARSALVSHVERLIVRSRCRPELHNTLSAMRAPRLALHVPRTGMLRRWDKALGSMVVCAWHVKEATLWPVRSSDIR